MDLLAVGGDLRYAHLVAAARARGWDARAFALEKASVPGVLNAVASDLPRAERAVLPNPFLKGLSLSLSDREIGADEVLRLLPFGAKLFLFGAGDVPDWAREKFSVYDLNKDERLLLDFARQTAEGAIVSALGRAPFELHHARAMIVGYGRIGRALHKMLNGFGAYVSVCARRDLSLREAASLGARSVSIEEIGFALPEQQMIFSTPPERVLGETELRAVDPRALILDLSSPPYGVDLPCAVRLGLNAWREPALPGRYCPFSAGGSLLSAVEFAEKEGER